MKKKNLKLAAVKYELESNLDNFLKVLEKLKFVEPSEVWFESRAYCWIEREPSDEDLDKVLELLGY